MTDYCIINGKKYNVNIISIEESFSILYTENTGRTLGVGAPMTLDPLGTFFGHKVTFARRRGFEDEYDRLFDLVSTPRYDGIPVEIVHNQTVLKYDAYISSGERAVKRIDPKTNTVYWGEFSLNIVPMEAQVLPE
jgi:hypothetical protein